MLNFVEETLNQMTLLIHEPIAISCIDSMAARRNDRLNAFFSEYLNKSIAIITFIAQQGGRPFCRQSQQILSPPDIAGWCASQYKIQRVAWRICHSVNFSGEAALRASQGFCLRRTVCRSAAQACARTIVLSIRICCLSRY